MHKNAMYHWDKPDVVNPVALRTVIRLLAHARNKVAFGLIAAGLLQFSSAQVLMSGGTYSQNFDSLANSGTGIGWTNNVTLSGWYASKSVAPNDVTAYNTGTGSSGTGALYSFVASGSTERAFGSVASGTPGNFAYGVRIINDTDSARSNLTVSYTREEW